MVTAPHIFYIHSINYFINKLKFTTNPCKMLVTFQFVLQTKKAIDLTMTLLYLPLNQSIHNLTHLPASGFIWLGLFAVLSSHKDSPCTP
jgi:hypothetical protein